MSVIAGTRVPVNRADREWPPIGDVRNLLVKGREIIVSSLCWIAGTIWQSFNLALQGKVIQASERRFYKLRGDVDTLSSMQRDADHAVQHLIATLRLADFIKTAQSRFDEIDRLAARLTELKSEFGDLELRLTPLQSNRGLLENLATELDALRDRLFADIGHLEQNGDRSLAGWVEDFAAAKQELQERVSRVSEEFAKLDVVRNDIGGLLANLRNSLKVKVSA